MKHKLLYPFIVGALGAFFTAPYNMSGMLNIACLAIMGHYFLYGIALTKKWQYSPLQLAVFCYAQPFLYLIGIPFQNNFTSIHAEIPYLFPIYVPVFTTVAALSLALGHIWTLPQVKKSLAIVLTLVWVSGGFFLLTEGLPLMSFDSNIFISENEAPHTPLKGLNRPEFSSQMLKGKKSYFLCWDAQHYDERQLREFQALYNLHRANTNLQMALIVCHSKERIEESQIHKCLSPYSFPKYEDTQGEWSTYSLKYQQNVGLMINKEGKIAYEITRDAQNSAGIWLDEMTALLAANTN